MLLWYLQRSTMTAAKAWCPLGTWEVQSAKVTQTRVFQDNFCLIVFHDFPLAQNLSKKAKVLDPLLQYLLRRLSHLNFLLGKESPFP